MSRREEDLFAEEQNMPAMSFGEHIEDLRRHLIRALLWLFLGVVIAFVPGLNLGQWVMKTMQAPAQKQLDKFYATRAKDRAADAEKTPTRRESMALEVEPEDFANAIRTVFPDVKLAEIKPETEKIKLRVTVGEADMIRSVAHTVEPKGALVSLAPMESFMIFFQVCMVTGLVLASPWVFREIWGFVAAGLYRHEQHYVNKFLPFSIGLFLGGVFLCFFFVLPYTLQFLLDFNVWLGIEPTLRITDWISFATIMPLVFGVCFQTPLVMLVLNKLNIFSAADFRSKRRIAILVMVIAAAVITPTGDPITLALLAVPMIALYELGIILVSDKKNAEVPSGV